MRAAKVACERVARAAADNTGSVRVLEKCGFEVVGEDRGFANARGAEIDELVLRLDG
ncbi:GNAT family N-acetyltransferase [Streptomyces sp. TE5632]